MAGETQITLVGNLTGDPDLRFTPDGRLMTCLFSARETDLRGPMRAGASDDDLIRLWAEATWRKPLAHGIDAPEQTAGDFVRPARTMSAIGG